MQTICVLEFVSYDTVSWMVIYLLREQTGESQSISSGNHSKRISNLSTTVAFIAESMTSHLSLDLWEKQYMELQQTKFFITAFFIFRKGASLATSPLNRFWPWYITSGIRSVDPCHCSWSFCAGFKVWHATAAALVQWYSRFGMLLNYVNYQGFHLKDKVIKEFNAILQINHHMTTTYSPLGNATVEKVNNDIQELLESLLSELQIKSSQCPLLVSVILSVLNHLPSSSPAKHSPFKIMTGLDAFRCLSLVFDHDENKEITSSLLLLNLKMSPNLSQDGMVLMKSLRLSQIGRLSSSIWSARLRKHCMLVALNFTVRKTSM